MRVMSARFDWMEGCGNRPFMEVAVDDVDSYQDVLFEERGGLWYGEREDGLVRFFAWRGPHNERGFGGASFELRMRDGTMRTLLGPWSSRAGVVNRAAFGPCVSVTLLDGMTGHRLSVALTLEVALGAARSADFESFGDEFPPESRPTLAEVVRFGDETYYEPALVLPDGRLWTKSVRGSDVRVVGEATL